MNRYTGSEPMSDDNQKRIVRRGVTDEGLERARRNAIREALSANEDGLGFNELLDEVDDLISRNTLQSRLEEYEKEGLITTPDDYRPGQKKNYQLTEKATKPEGVEVAYKDWQDNIIGIWKKALLMYEEGEPREEIVRFVLNETHRYNLATSTLASGKQEYKSSLGNVEISRDGIPPVPTDTPDSEFYKSLAAELYKFYTEKIFGDVYIQTDQKSSALKKDVMIETYESTIRLRQRMNKLWQQSPVPDLDIDTAD
jgi:DNA-binding HxlR family transcriptional regulator